MSNNIETLQKHPLYPNDPRKQALLEEAIRRGFIIRNSAPFLTGMKVYGLTQNGLQQWRNEAASR